MRSLFCVFFLTVVLHSINGQQYFKTKSNKISTDYVLALKDTINHLSETSDNDFFKKHCNSIYSVINSISLSPEDTLFLTDMYNAFNDEHDTCNPKKNSTYLNRSRPFILSWTSPTDGTVSFSWFKPPKDWDPEKIYPLYIELHGLWDVADNPINYLTYPYLTDASSSFAFENGYYLAPWGRGNFWYQGISETDIWECIDALEAITKVDSTRKYICGHSMGGYGAWSIARKSPDIWAALGIHAGALWYNNYSLVTSTVAKLLKNMPTYFVCGTDDNLLSVNQTAYQMLEDEGNDNIEFVTFSGGHEYIRENVENMYLWLKNFPHNGLNINKNSLADADNLQVKIFPNPINSRANISYSISENLYISLSLFDVYGRQIQKLENCFKSAGDYTLYFDASELEDGIYIVVLKAGSLVKETKLIKVN